jgi:hypothetical protein
MVPRWRIVADTLIRSQVELGPDVVGEPAVPAQVPSAPSEKK